MKSKRLSDLIKNKDKAISAEEYRIRYATERFLLRLQESEYKENFIIKGGFLLGVIFKVEQRTTKDLDALLKDISTDKENIFKVLKTITELDLKDGVSFELIDIIISQQESIYAGFRAKLKMRFLEGNAIVLFDLDLGIGDIITPSVEIVNIPLIFNENKEDYEALSLYAYPLETILAEKTEIILDLGTKNSRMKDFYDIHLILNDPDKPSIQDLFEAFENTWTSRHPDEAPISEELFEDWFFTVNEIIEDKGMNENAWENYIIGRDYIINLKLRTIAIQFKEYLKELQTVFKGEKHIESKS